MSDDSDEVDPHDWFSDKSNPPRDAKKRDEMPAWPSTEPPAEAASAPPTGGFPWGLTAGAPAPAGPESLDTVAVDAVALDAALEGPPHSPGEPPTVALPWETTVPELSATEPATELLGTGNVPRASDGSDIDSLFGHEQFKEYADEPLIPALPLPFSRPATAPSSATPANPAFASPLAGGTSPATAPQATPDANVPGPGSDGGELLSRNQRILLWAASGVLVVLALVVLFLLGTKLSGPHDSAPVVAASTSPSPSPTPAPAGPAAAGVHTWNELRGGECLDPFTSAWAETFTVVDCAAPHPAQLVVRGTFPAATPASSATPTPTPTPTGSAGSGYPGVAALQAQINLLCTASGVIDFDIAGAFSDIQFQASYAATAGEWAAGQHDYFCFVSRSSGEPLTGSLAAPAG
jgi:hypothetical protein